MGNARVSQVVLEVLSLVNANARVSQIVLEVLTVPFLFPTPPPVLPALNGFSMHKKPTFATIVQTAVSGREVTSAQQAYPLWEFELTYEVLREQTQNQTPDPYYASFTELEQISQVFLACNGQYGRFYYDDITDDSRTSQIIGTGDGTTTAFRMVRTWGFGALAFLEPIGGVNTNHTQNVYLNGVLQSGSNWSLDTTNTILTFNTAPGAGVTITSDFWFYYLCRFIEDVNDFEEFYHNLWSLKTLKFRSVKF